MVTLSVICIRSGQYNQPVHTGGWLGFDGALVKGPDGVYRNLQIAQLGGRPCCSPGAPQALNMPYGLFQCEPKSVPAIAHHDGTYQTQQGFRRQSRLEAWDFGPGEDTPQRC